MKRKLFKAAYQTAILVASVILLQMGALFTAETAAG